VVFDVFFKNEGIGKPSLILALACFLGLHACRQARSAQPSLPPSSGYLQHAALGIKTLQSWYDPATGLWKTTGWWNSANAVSVLADYSQLSGSSEYLVAMSNTFNVNAGSGFLNEYYDDEGWWALAWIAAYDGTGDAQYLGMSQRIFSDMFTGWDSTCGGGIWWNKDRKYKNAIANELFLSVAANLAARTTGAQQASNLDWAKREWTWFSGSGMINSESLINDGLNSSCQNNGQTTWSYNQGVILGGLAALSRDTGDQSLSQQAKMIALSAITHLSDANGILHDVCEPKCGADGVQFKGIFVRNLGALDSAFPLAQFKAFLETNAKTIWTNDRGPNDQFGLVWSGPFLPANAATQTSAIDCLLAADQVTQQRSLAKGPDYQHGKFSDPKRASGD
jgi:predicted alpha-1,6-mannanase (GH76 family)